MAITREQAETADVFHVTTLRPCDSKNGPERWRRNGKTIGWKRSPENFRIPVKHGLRTYGYLERLTTWDNVTNVHTGADCPVAPEGHN